MQQGGNHRLRIHVPFGQRTGYRQRMRDIGFAGKALLPLVRRIAEPVGFADELNFFGLEVAQAINEDPERRIFSGQRMRI